MKVVIALQAEHSLEVLLEVARLARSTFFYHQARLAGPDPQAELKTAITRSSKPTGVVGIAVSTGNCATAGGGSRSRPCSS